MQLGQLLVLKCKESTPEEPVAESPDDIQDVEYEDVK
jgi:hypothetical protein